MIVFAREPLEDCWSEIYDKPNGLAYIHWCETQKFQSEQEYNPLFDRYNQYAKNDWFVQLTVRDEGRLVGYSGFYVIPSMHTQALIATEDTWFLLPEYRKGWTALKLFKFGEQICRGLGVVRSYLTVPYSKDKGLNALVERMGYGPFSLGYSKSLTKS